MPTTDNPLNIPLRPSVTLKWIWIASCAIVLAVLLFLPMDWRFRFMFVIAWLAFALRLRVQWQKLSAVEMLHVTRNGFSITTAAGTEDAELGGAPYVTYPLMILPLRSRCQQFSLICLPDSAHRDDLRRLRVWLSLRGGK